MNTFKRKALAAAVFAGLGVGSAHAVYQDPNGLGQGLIFPYYTVQSVDGTAFNTYVSVVNTTATGKVVKVRFREGKNSREVLDFNLYLSPNDVWTGAIIPADATDASPGRLITADVSCTNPAIPATGVDFRNFQYSGAFDDAAGTTLARSREGYIEMLEMATVIGPSLTAITHAAATNVPTCAGVTGPGPNALPLADQAAPTGGLSGTGTLINVNNGSDSGYNAIALGNVTAANIYTDIGSEVGNFAQADPVSIVVTSSATGTRSYTSGWLAGIDAVSATMMHQNVINEYVLDAGTKSNTDWVMTFPTKRFYVTTAAAAAPFTNKFTATGSCESFGFQFFNREERGAAAAGGDFSPLPPTLVAGLCWESTILSIRSGQTHNPTGTTSGVLGSVNSLAVNVTTGYQNGWGNLSFTGANSLVGLVSQAGSFTLNIGTAAAAAGAQTFLGLPVTGFMARTFNNGTLTCSGAACQGNYGSLFTHNYIDNITPQP
ncbi:MAG: hypothetical protein AB7P08_09130 [Burkholderiales bacterium]